MTGGETGRIFHRLCETAFGPVALLWSGRKGAPRIARILIGGPGAPAARMRARLRRAAARSCPRIDDFAERMAAFLAGVDVRFPVRMLRLDLCTPRQRKILRACLAIPRGRVSTYRLLAARAGMPNAARAVGNAMARNPFPIVIPCHRVIRTDGSLGGYGGGIRMKRALLLMEGALPKRREAAFRTARH